MIGSIFIKAYTRYGVEFQEIMETIFETDRGFYLISPLGFKKIIHFLENEYQSHLQFSGETITDVRSDCETLLVRLENNDFIMIGWSITNESMHNVQKISFENHESLDKNLIPWFSTMQQLDENNPRYQFD